MQKLLLFIFEQVFRMNLFKKRTMLMLSCMYTNIRIYVLRLIVTFEST